MSRRTNTSIVEDSVDGESAEVRVAAMPPLAGVYNTSKKRRPTHHPRPKRAHAEMNAEQPVKLVPVTIDLELDGNNKIKDSFTWNVNETVLTPEQFARILVDDLETSLGTQLEKQVAQAIRAQCQAFAGAIVEDDVESGHVREEGEPMDGIEDLRIVIKLDLHVGNLHLRDKFEWPLFRTYAVTPEQFARHLASDMGVGGEFISQIAHAIREQVCYARLNYDETMAAPDWVRLSRPPFRNENEEEEWEPELKVLDEEEMDKISKERERNVRRMRRATRATGRGSSRADPPPPPPPKQDPIMQQQQQQQQMPFNMMQMQMQMHMQMQGPFGTPFGNFQGSPMAGLPYMNTLPGTQISPQGKAGYLNYGNEDFAALSFAPLLAAPGMIPNYPMPGSSPQRNKSTPKKVLPTPESAALLARQLEMIQSSPPGHASSEEHTPAGQTSRRHRGFGASARPFNEDGAIEFGDHRKNWRCTWCFLSGRYTPTLRKGPLGSKTLCNACGLWFSKHASLPQDRFQEHQNTVIPQF